MTPHTLHTCVRLLCDDPVDGVLGVKDDEAESSGISGSKVRFDGDVLHRSECAKILRQILILEFPR